MHQLASERRNVTDFSSADKDRIEQRPSGATERFVETGDAGIPVKPVE